MIAEASVTQGQAPAAQHAPERLPVWLVALLGLLIAQRLLYHGSFVVHDPFALSTFSDGQVYEEAARDILAHPPLGTAPFFLQGLYAYALAAGLALRGVLLDALLLQLVLCALGALAFFKAARAWHGALAGTLCTCALLSNAALAFYENKYLSAALGVVCNVLALSAFAELRTRLSKRGAFGLGFANGLCVLARPNLLLALPFSGIALLLLARRRQQRSARYLLCACAGLVLSLAPMATRNWLVTGHASLLPSHGGGIPFYIGNNPTANGLWNTAGGLISGQVLLERQELSARLQIAPDSPDADTAIGRALYGRAFAFMRDQPLAWLRLEARKLWYLLGNDEFVHDYDWHGERELLGNVGAASLPFGLLLGFGLLGMSVLARGGPYDRCLCLVLLGQLLAVCLANLLWFTSAQNRLPLLVPLAFAAGPGVLAARRGWSHAAAGSGAVASARPSERAAAAVCLLVALQAFIPRSHARQPSAAHYYNLANVEETLGRTADALAHYQRAAQRNPQQPMFWFRLAYLARRSGHAVEAAAALDQLVRIDAQLGLPDELRIAAAHERAQLRQTPAASPTPDLQPAPQ